MKHDKDLEVLYPKDVIKAWRRQKHTPWYKRLLAAICNFIDTLMGEIE